MTPKQNTILRVTFNIDNNLNGEVAMIRALLRRLNVLHARTRPKSALKELLGGGKLGDQLEAGRARSRQVQQSKTGTQTQPTTQETKSTALVTQPQLPAKIEVRTKKFNPPKIAFRYISLKEQRFEPPITVFADSTDSGGGTT